LWHQRGLGVQQNIFAIADSIEKGRCCSDSQQDL
jgi:hypothetical protein